MHGNGSGHPAPPPAVCATDATPPDAPAQPQAPIARRALLGIGALAAAGRAGAQGTSVTTSAPSTPLIRDELVALVHRTSFGYTPELHGEARARGFDGYLNWQLDPASIDDAELDTKLAAYPHLELSAADIYAAHTSGQTPHQELREARLLRAVESKRQLYERMVEFWADHFSVPIWFEKRYLFLLRVEYDATVIRPHALGSFRDMLHASARSAAMLKYLDNIANVDGAENENYAREVMELHTLGVDGPYTEDDVRELARVFTGWTYDPVSMPTYGTFRFDDSKHDQGTKNVLGLQLTPNGEQEALDVLDLLASHPATAAYVSRKLTNWLLGYEPPQALVDEVAQVFLQTDGDIPSLIRTILTPDNIVASDVWRDRKLKRPLHFAASLCRATGAQIVDPGLALFNLESMGQLPFDWRPPNGYPDSYGAWVWLQYPRMQFAVALFGDAAPGLRLTAAALQQLLGSTPAWRWAQAIAILLTGGTMSEEEIVVLQNFIDNSPGGLSSQKLTESFSTAALSPSVQEY